MREGGREGWSEGGWEVGTQKGGWREKLRANEKR